MSCWTDQWKDFVTRTSYGIYDQALMYSGYPGEILARISSIISPIR